jgi:hypothetical protein
MGTPRDRARKLVPGAVSILVLLVLFLVGQSAVAAPDGSQLADRYRFQELPIAMPPGYDNQPMKTVRQVNPAYEHLVSWISSVGASIAMNDLVGHGRADALCIVDTRTNSVIVTYTPTAPQRDRFTPFTLKAAPLPYDDTMAPTNCTPGDFNGDGRMDLLVTYWGRTPILFLGRATATTPSPAAYEPTELVPQVSSDGRYHGPRWNTDADYVADLDGDGHPDIVIGNYFPDSDVLDPHGLNNVQMNLSLSSATNGGGDRVLRFLSGAGGDHPTASYVEDRDAIPYDASTGWTLAISGADLTGAGVPDMYLANDFGHGHLLHNVSTPGRIRFTEAKGRRTPDTPKSFVLGNGSFKGMGVDFGDVNRTGQFDFAVSNITTAWGLQESNFLFMNQARDNAAMAGSLADGVAPFTQEAQQYGVAWTGWCWDVKFGDFRNDGTLAMVQADGFVKGDTDRWNWLQEMAMTNDDLLTNPAMWPNVRPGDDIAGDQALAFYARAAGGKYVNISKDLGLAVPTPTRGIATADTTGSGALDLAIARQWGPPVFYANTSPDRGDYLDLNLVRPAAPGQSGGLAGVGTPAYDATVTVTTPSGSQVSQLDGGGGHGGFRSFGVHFGLGDEMGPVGVQVRWLDGHGHRHQQTTTLKPGEHTLMLTDGIQEVTNR